MYVGGYTKQSETDTNAEHLFKVVATKQRILIGFVTIGDSSEENGDLL